jgi:hypothetical protein
VGGASALCLVVCAPLGAGEVASSNRVHALAVRESFDHWLRGSESINGLPAALGVAVLRSLELLLRQSLSLVEHVEEQVEATRDAVGCARFVFGLAIVAAGALVVRVVSRVSGLDAWLNRLWNGSRSR